MLLSYKYRLYPNRAQAAALDGMLGAFCDLYNTALQQRIEAWDRRRISLSYGNQASELKAVRAADERLAGFSFSAEQQVLRRLDKAFKAFFRRIKAGDKPGFPRFRPKSQFDSADFRVGDGLTIRRTGRLGIVGIPGEIKVRWHRALPAKPGAAVVFRSLGQWFVIFQVEVLGADPRPDFVPVGIDLGLNALVALSTGETVARQNWTKSAAKGLRRRQRELARCKRGSKRRAKAKARLAAYSRKVANKRRDMLHKLSADLVSRFSAIAVEDLNVKSLARGMLAKEVNDAAWGQLIAFLRYKAEKAGGAVVAVDPRGTSQTCPECGTIKAKMLSERVHNCECGCVLDRDVAAAKIVHLRAFGHGTCLRAISEPVAA